MSVSKFVSVSFALIAASSFALAAEAETKGGYEWMPAEAEGAHLQANEATTAQVILPVLETKIPKATADASKFTKEYVIDLQKFGIRKDGTDAEATSRGLNNALQDAKTVGANRIVFPKGTYLISEKEPILLNHQNTIIDLNGSTLQMNPNGLPDYSMVVVADETLNFRLTNGILMGDRDKHDYKTIKATHEHCRLLRFAGGKEMEFDHLTISNAPGFAVTTVPSGGQPGRAGLLSMIFHWVLIRDLESGAFSDAGLPVADATKTRTTKPYDVSKCGGEFEFGWTEGYMGFPFIKDRNYQTVFFDKDMKFIQKNKSIQYKKIPIPEGAQFVQLEFNQPEVSSETNHPGAAKAGHCGRITNFRPPSEVHFHHNTMIYNRALGFAFTGGVKWIMENNHFERNGGQAPGFGIDFEDGWELMQNIVFRKNTFTQNSNDLVVCAGTELLFEDNHFENSVVFSGRTFNYTFRKNRVVGGRVFFSTRSGVLTIHDNSYENLSGMFLTFDGKGIADGFLRLPGQNVVTPPIELKNEKLVNVGPVTGTYLKFVDSKLENVRLVAGKATVLAWLENCDLNETTLTYEATGPTVNLRVENSRGSLIEQGPGMDRRKEMSPLVHGK